MTGGGEGRIRVGEQGKGEHGGNLFLRRGSESEDECGGVCPRKEHERDMDSVGFGVWWGAMPGCCPASVAVVIAAGFHLARFMCPMGDPSTRSAPCSPAAFPDFPRAFVILSLWQRWDVALPAPLCPTTAGHSRAQGMQPSWEESPQAHPLLPFPFAQSHYPSLFFLIPP